MKMRFRSLRTVFLFMLAGAALPVAAQYEPTTPQGQAQAVNAQNAANPRRRSLIRAAGRRFIPSLAPSISRPVIRLLRSSTWRLPSTSIPASITPTACVA